MSYFLQKICPICDQPAIKILRDKIATRICENGHTWFPIKNPAPQPKDTE